IRMVLVCYLIMNVYQNLIAACYPQDSAPAIRKTFRVIVWPVYYLDFPTVLDFAKVGHPFFVHFADHLSLKIDTVGPMASNRNGIVHRSVDRILAFQTDKLDTHRCKV